jgi:DNA-binding response OmpR family regulator
LQLGGSTAQPEVFQIGGIALDDSAKAVTPDGEPVSLTPTEYEILKLLMASAAQNRQRRYRSAKYENLRSMTTGSQVFRQSHSMDCYRIVIDTKF